MRDILKSALWALPLLISAAAGAADSPLGTPTEQVGRYSNNHAEIVRAALPRIDAPGLSTLMAGVARAAAAEKPLAIGSERDLEAFFGLRKPGQRTPDGFMEAGDAVYRLQADNGRLWVSWRRSPKPVARADFAGQLHAIKASHSRLARRLGIPRDEMMFTDFREILSRTDARPGVEQGRTEPIMAEGATTTILRSVGGVLVEGSRLRISSLDSDTLALVDARWPQVRLADEALRTLRAPHEVLEPIIRRVAAHNKGMAVSVRMAVVLRPLDPAKPGQFVPALKVGVKPASVKTRTGVRTDAGEVFFSDLVQGSPPFADKDQADEARSTEN